MHMLMLSTPTVALYIQAYELIRSVQNCRIFFTDPQNPFQYNSARLSTINTMQVNTESEILCPNSTFYNGGLWVRVRETFFMKNPNFSDTARYRCWIVSDKYNANQ